MVQPGSRLGSWLAPTGTSEATAPSFHPYPLAHFLHLCQTAWHKPCVVSSWAWRGVATSGGALAVTAWALWRGRARQLPKTKAAHHLPGPSKEK